MDGAALADDQSGVTFTAELCIPWDAPEAVIDIDSEDLVSLGSFPDKVGLFGRRKDAAVSRTGQQKRPICGSGRTRGRPWLPRRNSSGHGR